jgi:hypothetical protein
VAGDGDDAARVAHLAFGWAAMGLGLVGVGVGTAFSVSARSTNDESREHCLPDDPTLCDALGAELRDDAIAEQNGAIVGFAVGGALVVTGVALLLTVPADEQAASAVQLSPWLSPRLVGGSLALGF